MPISHKTLSHVFRTKPAKAGLAAGCAAVAGGLLLALLPTTAAAAATATHTSRNLVIRPSFSFDPFPSFSFSDPSSPATTGDPGGGFTTTPARRHKSPSPQASPQDSTSQQPDFNYVSTFSPAPIVKTSANTNATAACLANGQPVTNSAGDIDLPGIAGSSKDAGHIGGLPITRMGPTAMLPPQIDETSLAQLQVTRNVDASSANLSMIASSGYRFPCIHIALGPGKGYSSVEYALVNAGLVADDRSPAGKTELLTWTYSTILWSYSVPGSTKVHQGSGQINAQPNVVTTSVAHDTRAIALGIIGLTLVVALALIGLYIGGMRRNRRRYRQRYYRRASLRAEREAMMASVEMAQEAQAAEAARWAAIAEREAHEAEVREREEAEAREREAAEAREVELREAEEQRRAEAEAREAEERREAEAREAGASEPEPEAEPEAEAPEPEPETEPEAEVSEPEPETEPEAESESVAATSEEPEQDADEPEPEPESATEPESEPEPEPEEDHQDAEERQEAEADQQAEPEAEADSEAETEPEAKAEPEAQSESEPEPESEQEPQSEPDAESDSDAESESESETSGSAGYRKTPV